MSRAKEDNNEGEKRKSYHEKLLSSGSRFLNGGWICDRAFIIISLAESERRFNYE